MRSRRTCVYCGDAEGLTNEHVYPECFQRTFKAFSIVKTPGGEKAIPGAQEVHDVCGACNNGPLSILDNIFCALNERYFSTIIRPGQRVRFEYDFDQLLRILLKIGYNVARTRNWPLSQWQEASQYILGNAPCPHGFRVFLQLMLSTPAIKTDLPVSPGTTEIPPLPIHVELINVNAIPGLALIYSISVWSYRFFVLRENSGVPSRLRERGVASWYKGTKSARELRRVGVSTLYSSTATFLDDLKDNPRFRSQLLEARKLKSEMDSKKPKES